MQRNFAITYQSTDNLFFTLLERTVHNQWYKYLESIKNSLDIYRSISSAVVYFTDIVRKSMDKGQLTEPCS